MMQFDVLRNVWKEWPICIRLGGIYPAGDLQRVVGWCYQTFGNPDDNRNWKYTSRTGTIYLLREEDLTMFIMKWDHVNQE